MTAWLVAANTGLLAGLVMAGCVLGLAIAYRLFNFADLTVEGSFLLGAVGVAIAQKQGLPLWISLLVAMGLGAAAGALTALLHARFRVNKFLAGIVVAAVCYTLGLRLMGSSNIGLLGEAALFDQLSSAGQVGVLSVTVAILSAASYFALGSRVGLRLRTAGCNPNYARMLDINVGRSLVLALGFTNALAAFSGGLLALYQGFADIGLGQGVLIVALASLAIGERLLSEGKLSLVTYVLAAGVLGGVVYQLIIAFAIRLGLNPVDLKLVTAMFVVALVAIRVRRDEDSALQ